MKTTKAVFGIITISLALTGQVQAQSFLTNGLVAYYPFNGNANDASGNGNNGTPINVTLAPDRFGVPNACYSFNGTNSHVDVGSSIQLGKPHDAMAISVWFLLGNVFNPHFDADFVLVSDYSGPDGHVTGDYSFFGEINFQHYGGVTNLLFMDRSYPPASATVYSPAVVNDNRWHSCTVVVDGQGTISIYIDGALSAQGAYDSSLDYTHGQFWRIGADQWNNQLWNVLNGFIDDVRFYNRALSSSEVAQLYAIESVPVLNVRKAVYLDSSNLHVGINYQVQVSTDLNTWTNSGGPFTATNSTWRSANYWDVDNWGKLFFRLQVAP